jgi:hypothetical protein
MGSNLMEDLRTLLNDLDYPASKQDIVDQAERHGVKDETLRAVRALPPVDYRNDAEVLRSVAADPVEVAGQTAANRAHQRRHHTHPGLAEHMKDTKPSPIEDELGWNKGS